MIDEPLTEEQKEKLLNDLKAGHEYSEAWSKLEIFVEDKKALLFDAFVNTPATDRDRLVEIKLQCSAIEALKSEFLGYITTGRFAAELLDQSGE